MYHSLFGLFQQFQNCPVSCPPLILSTCLTFSVLTHILSVFLQSENILDSESSPRSRPPTVTTDNFFITADFRLVLELAPYQDVSSYLSEAFWGVGRNEDLGHEPVPF